MHQPLHLLFPCSCLGCRTHGELSWSTWPKATLRGKSIRMGESGGLMLCSYHSSPNCLCPRCYSREEQPSILLSFWVSVSVVKPIFQLIQWVTYMGYLLWTRLYENSFMYILKSLQQSCEVRVLSPPIDNLRELSEIICTRRNGEARIQIEVCWLP